jgi:hypothetical protein
MITYLAKLLDITLNNNAIPGDWKEVLVVSIYKGFIRSVFGKNRSVSLLWCFGKKWNTLYQGA